MEQAATDRGVPGTDRSFWERPETVAWFAARPPDGRVVAHFAGRARADRVLDLGCAAGRHADWLAADGLDPLVETAAVLATTMGGHRTTLNGHFRRRVAAAPPKEIP